MLTAAMAASPAAASGPRSHAAARNAWKRSPVTPELSGAVRKRVLALARRGKRLGVRRDVVAKLGDSITASGAYLAPLACSTPVWGGWSHLRGAVRFFSRETVPGDTEAACGITNSFSRDSTAAVKGWTTENALLARTPPPNGCGPQSSIGCEVDLIHPSVALIMFGTNDVDTTNGTNFRRHLSHIARIVERSGAIPVISTIPPRETTARLHAKTERFNDAIVQLAANRHLPLWNYWRQLEAPRVPGHGIGPDGVHPSICSTCSAINFTPAGLRQGYALRNLGALRVLDRLRRNVLERPRLGGSGS